MRDFTLKDGFLLSEILDKMDFQVDLNQYADEKVNQAYIGGQMMLLFIRKMHLAEKEIMKLMANMTDEPMADVEKWDVGKIKEFLNELVQQDGLKDFFG